VAAPVVEKRLCSARGRGGDRCRQLRQASASRHDRARAGRLATPARAAPKPGPFPNTRPGEEERSSKSDVGPADPPK
jgi:hypothetical protein